MSHPNKTLNSTSNVQSAEQIIVSVDVLELIEQGLYTWEDAERLLKRHNNSEHSISADETVQNLLYISPNPTSSYVTLTFFHNFDNRDILFPQNFVVELFYLEKHINTFTFNNSNGKETISETYLEKDGIYRVVSNIGGTNFTTTFMVMKK